ncbi:hypothetical protein GCM10027275_10330 [Rhabdobacter roseus]|uniref:Uncharacterized protein n=1 Tax=Rhabdobacter roseus TaxID=1655419 RepID=A0A840TI15_9BACT|nr:hypothetical protein [Rhabdobacter roseus]MBB5282941.1 hypothetical protein [Rhabdobacter roseus]
MKHCFTLPALLVLITSAALAQNKIITPAQQPLVVGNAGLRHAALNASSPTAPWNGKALSLDANGLMILVKDSAGGSGSTLWNVSGSHINYLPGNVGIGTATPLQRLHVNGDINLSSGSGLRINNVPFLRTIGTENTFIGVNIANSLSTGSFNLFIGTNAGRDNTSGYNNVFLGVNAGRASTSAYNNVFLGRDAGLNTGTGYNNMFIGYQSGQANTNGRNNTFIGPQSGISNTSGYNNLLFGTNAGYSNSIGFNNVMIGVNAGRLTTSGESNIFLGYNAGYNNSSGKNNIAIGFEAGKNNTTGNNNIFIGNQSNAASANLVNVVALGYDASVAQSNSIILGSSGINVGIGTSAPTARLHVTAGGTTATGVRLENLPTSTGTVYPLYVDANGNVMKASTAGARALAADESNWERTAQDHLLNRNGGGVLIGSGFNTLPTGYQLYVSEGILTERVKVALKSTDEWRDHVFRDDYKLRPLDETEAFIKQHRHLPGVPSAEEMVKQGNDLHRTDALLLEKIEELTLYLLEVKKEYSTLKTEGEDMKSVIRQLAENNDRLSKEVERLKKYLSK